MGLLVNCTKLCSFFLGALLFWLLIGTHPIPVHADTPNITLSNRTSLYNYDITGSGRASSFYPQGFQYLHESDLRMDNRFGDWKSKLNINLRFTQNDKFDTQRASIERLAWVIKNKNIQIDLGDYFANLSQYTLNKSIKGFGFQHKLGEKTYYRATFGTFDSQWEYLYQQVVGEPMDRFGGGLRFQHSDDHYRVGLNLAYVEDAKGDINRGTEDAFKQYVPSIDWYFKYKALSISGESAYGNTRAFPLNAINSKMIGSAHKVSIRYRVGGLKLSSKLENVSTFFRTLGGAASPDRVRYFTKADLRLNRDWSLFTLWNQSRNNLMNNPAITSVVVNTGEFGVKRKRLFNRKNLVVSLSVRQRWNRSELSSSKKVTSRIKTGVSDTFAKKVRVRATMERILDRKATAGYVNRNFYTFNLSSRHRLLRGDLRIRPRINASFQENDNLIVGGNDTNKALRLDISGTYKRKLSFGVNAKAGINRLVDPKQDNVRKTNQRIFIAYKPRWKQAWLKRSAIKLEFTNNQYHFTTAIKNFSEKVFMLSITSDLNFEKGAI